MGTIIHQKDSKKQKKDISSKKNKKKKASQNLNDKLDDISNRLKILENLVFPKINPEKIGETDSKDDYQKQNIFTFLLKTINQLNENLEKNTSEKNGEIDFIGNFQNQNIFYSLLVILNQLNTKIENIKNEIIENENIESIKDTKDKKSKNNRNTVNKKKAESNNLQESENHEENQIPTNIKNMERVPKSVSSKLIKIQKFKNEGWKQFLSKNPTQSEESYIKKITRQPIAEAHQKILKSDSCQQYSNNLWVISIEDFKIKINQIITNELFDVLDNRFNEIVTFHEGLGSKGKPERALRRYRKNFLEDFGLIEIPINEGDKFSDEKHYVLEQKTDNNKPDRVVLKILNPGYQYRETGEIIKKANVTVNYRF